MTAEGTKWPAHVDATKSPRLTVGRALAGRLFAISEAMGKTPRTGMVVMEQLNLSKAIRSHIERLFADHGAVADARIEETLLIADGFYCGRRYSYGQLQAIWLAKQDELEFCKADGTVEKTVLAEIIEPHRRAA
jgi:hypothetical protein